MDLFILIIKVLLNIVLLFVNFILIWYWSFSGNLLKFLLIIYKFLEVIFQLIIFEYLCIRLFYSFLFIHVIFWWLGRSVRLVKIRSINFKWIDKLKSLSQLSMFSCFRFSLFFSRVCLFASLVAILQCLFPMYFPKSSFLS